MIYSVFQKLKTLFWYLVSPPYCAYCRTFLQKCVPLCTKCLQKIQPIVSKQLSITQTKNVRVFSISNYREPLKSLILAKGWSDIAVSNQLGELLWNLSNIKYLDFDYIVPIPLHWSRYAWRGYNQAEEIAHIIAKKSGKPVIKALKRKKRTQFQFLLPVNERKENVKKVFVLVDSAKKILHGNRILLVDDLMTTGSTLQQAAKEIFKTKPEKVIAAVICRVI